MWEVKTENISFDSACPGQKTAGYFFVSPQLERPKALVQLCHGMCEHLGRYEDFAAFLVRHGYGVFGNDHLGHGRTSNLGGEDGFFAEKNGRYFVLKDLKTMNELGRERWPGQPVILLGHSMGSFFARWFAAEYPDALDALIISGTAGPNPAAGAGSLAADLMCLLQGAHGHSPLLQKLAFGNYLARVENPKTPHDWISRDRDVVRRYAADPKCTFTFTNSAMGELTRTLRQVSGQDWADRLRKAMPVLLLAGDADPVGGYGNGVRQVYAMLQKAGLTDLTLTLYPGGRHEMLNEINREQVYADVLAWCDRALDRMA